ncbi:MAG TPA: MFS transporter [Burkholderiales bacterium]|nr:MFS transporter [Burkholderiales bacterium]
MRPGERWLTRPVLAWALYDVASSAFAAVVPPFFGLYFVSAIASDLPGAQTQWGLIAALALTLAGLLAPIAGAWADRRGRWLGLLAAATALCVIATVAMPTTAPGKVVWAAALFVAAQVGYTLAVSIYDSLLVRVAAPAHAGRVSGFGWSVGFGGGILALATSLILLRGLPADAQAERLPDAFLLAGLLFAGFAVPGLLGLRHLGGPPAAARAFALGDAYASVLSTLRHWRRQREVFRFMIAYYLLNDALVTLLFFIAILMRTRFGLSVEGMLSLALLYHVTAAPATLAFGHAADRWGQRPVICVQVAILGVAILVLGFGTGTGAALAVIVLLGLVYGSLQAVCRSLLALLVQPEKAAELFGFNAVAGRLSAALGPLVFGAVAAASGSETVALVSLLAFLIAGAAVLGSLRIPAPRIVSFASDGARGG